MTLNKKKDVGRKLRAPAGAQAWDLADNGNPREVTTPEGCGWEVLDGYCVGEVTAVILGNVATLRGGPDNSEIMVRGRDVEELAP